MPLAIGLLLPPHFSGVMSMKSGEPSGLETGGLALIGLPMKPVFSGVPPGEGQAMLQGQAPEGVLSGLEASLRGSNLRGSGAARLWGVDVGEPMGLMAAKFAGVATAATGVAVKSELEARRTSRRMGAKGQTLRRQAVLFASLGVQATPPVGVGASLRLMEDGLLGDGQSVGGALGTPDTIDIGVEREDRLPGCVAMRASFLAGA